MRKRYGWAGKGLALLAAVCLLAGMGASVARAAEVDITEDFTDLNFRAAVYEVIGKAESEPIYDNDLVNIEILSVGNRNIQSLAGLEHFTQLQRLYCSDNDLTSLPVLPIDLTILFCHDNRLTSLPELSSELIHLLCRNNQIAIMPALPSKLDSLDCDNNLLTGLPEFPLTLKQLNCKYNKITSLPSLPSTLNYLDCRDNQLTGLDVSALDYVGYLDCSYNLIADKTDVTGFASDKWNDRNYVFTPQLTVEDKGLIFDTESGMFYIDLFGYGSLHPNDPKYTGQADKWSWDSISKTLSLNGFEWLTPAARALSVWGADRITINLMGENRFGFDKNESVDAYSGIIYFTPNIVTITGKGTLDASYIGGASRLTITDGTIIAHGGIHSGTLILAGGSLLADGNDTFGLNCANVNIAGGILTARGEMHASSSFLLVTASEYIYWTNTTTANPGGMGTVCELENNGFVNSNLYKYIRIESPNSALLHSPTDITDDFSDLNFREAVYMEIGKTAPEPILDTDVAWITMLSAANSNVKSLSGLEHFSSLTNLFCHTNRLESLPEALPPRLTQLECSENMLTSLPTLPSGLITLSCWDNQLVSLPELPSSLYDLRCASNRLTALPEILPSGLTELWCGGNQLNSLPSLPNSLKFISCSDNQLAALPALPTDLVTLVCPSNRLTLLPALPQSLNRLYCNNNWLTELDVSGLSLDFLDCSRNNLTSTSAVIGFNKRWDNYNYYFYPQNPTVTLTGTIRSYSPNAPATIQLIQNGKEICKTDTNTYSGSGQASQSFTIPNIAPGD